MKYLSTLLCCFCLVNMSYASRANFVENTPEVDAAKSGLESNIAIWNASSTRSKEDLARNLANWRDGVLNLAEKVCGVADDMSGPDCTVDVDVGVKKDNKFLMIPSFQKGANNKKTFPSLAITVNDFIIEAPVEKNLDKDRFFTFAGNRKNYKNFYRSKVNVPAVVHPFKVPPVVLQAGIDNVEVIEPGEEKEQTVAFKLEPITGNAAVQDNRCYELIAAEEVIPTDLFYIKDRICYLVKVKNGRCRKLSPQGTAASVEEIFKTTSVYTTDKRTNRFVDGNLLNGLYKLNADKKLVSLDKRLQQIPSMNNLELSSIDGNYWRVSSYKNDQLADSLDSRIHDFNNSSYLTSINIGDFPLSDDFFNKLAPSSTRLKQVVLTNWSSLSNLQSYQIANTEEFFIPYVLLTKWQDGNVFADMMQLLKDNGIKVVYPNSKLQFNLGMRFNAVNPADDLLRQLITIDPSLAEKTAGAPVTYMGSHGSNQQTLSMTVAHAKPPVVNMDRGLKIMAAAPGKPASLDLSYANLITKDQIKSMNTELDDYEVNFRIDLNGYANNGPINLSYQLSSYAEPIESIRHMLTPGGKLPQALTATPNLHYDNSVVFSGGVKEHQHEFAMQKSDFINCNTGLLANMKFEGNDFKLNGVSWFVNKKVTKLCLCENEIGDTEVVALARDLENNKTVTTLDLRKNNIGDVGAAALAKVLETNKTLTTVYLQGNQIGDAGAVAFANALKINKTLITLGLECNRIGDAGTIALAESLVANETLVTLYLRENQIKNDGAEALAKVLKTNKTLATLGLECNQIEDKGTIALATTLETNKTLVALYLRKNNIGSAGAAAFAKALRTNKALATLGLECNHVGSAGAITLAETLVTNETLTTLYLRENELEDEVAVAFAKAILVNKALTTLGLECNRIKNAGAIALAEVLVTNKTLITLYLRENAIGDEGAVAFARVMKLNKTLVDLAL